MYNPFRVLFLLSGLLIGSQLQAQQLSNSPYSRFGLGEQFFGSGSMRNAGMGQVGAATFNVNGAWINDVNPALGYYNPAVTFEAAVISELKRLSDGRTSQIDGAASLNYLALSIPISRRWTASIGLKPYTRVNYTTFLNNPVEGEPSVTTFTEYRGEGGINEVYFSHGIRITDGLSIGATGSYLFGTINRDASTVLVDADDPNYALQKTLIHTTTKYSGLMAKGGVHYRKKVGENLNLGVGGTYTAQTMLHGNRIVSQERRLLDESLLARTATDSTNGHATLPQNFQVGFGLDNGRNWSAGLDYTRFQASDFRGFSQEKNAGPAEFGDGFRISAGAELTPNPGSVSSYMSRVIYRLGGYYSHAEVMTSSGAHNLNNTALTWGLSFPIGRGVRPPDYTQAMLNTSFTVGVQEAKESGLKEQFFRVGLGVTFNNRWFIKRRFD